jgi:hyperosmotically inducible periplasmic protein
MDNQRNKIALMALVGGALIGGAALAANQTETVDKASQEAKQAGEAAKQAGEDATEAAKKASKAAEEEAKKAGEQIDEAASKSKKEIDEEAASAKKVVEETAKGEGTSPQLQGQLERKLSTDQRLHGSDITTAVDDKGVVTLSGTVPTEKAKARALQVTTGLKGVTEVRDELTVQSKE